MATVKVGHSGANTVGDIEGGNVPARLDVDDNITADHIYDTERAYPSYKDMVDLEVDAIWSNYLNEETIELDRLIECKDSMHDAISYGWSAVIIDARKERKNIERWHIQIDGTGFEVIETSRHGFPLKIQVQARFSESTDTINYIVPHYPCETYEVEVDGETYAEYDRSRPIPKQYGFFIVRNRGGKKGIKGPPEYLRLIRFIRKVADIVENYAAYAENQALGHVIFGLEKNTKENRASIKAQYTQQINHRKLTIIGKEDWADWISPMNSAWDPWAMLEYIDKLIARSTQMNKLMLEGDPSGNLSSSETAINNWESKIKEKQAYWLGQYRPIFMALGASEDVAFKDPSKPSFTSLMEGLANLRVALYGIIMQEDYVMLVNEYLMKHGYDEVRPASKEEMQLMNGGSDQNGDPGSSEGQSETGREE